jgi:hypothetical protein
MAGLRDGSGADASGRPVTAAYEHLLQTGPGGISQASPSQSVYPTSPRRRSSGTVAP